MCHDPKNIPLQLLGENRQMVGNPQTQKHKKRRKYNYIVSQNKSNRIGTEQTKCVSTGYSKCDRSCYTKSCLAHQITLTLRRLFTPNITNRVTKTVVKGILSLP